jgi:hypothetical protein
MYTSGSKMLEKTADGSIVEILQDLAPDFEAGDGKRFYGKLKLPLAFYHYLGAPSQQASPAALKEYGDNLSEYIDFIKVFNGCTLYDKIFSLYSFGADFIRSMKLEDQSPYRIEDENPTFSVLSDKERNERDRKVGTLYLENEYTIYLSPSGECFLRDENDRTLRFAGFNAAVSQIVAALDHVLPFPRIPDENAAKEIESILVRSVKAASL